MHTSIIMLAVQAVLTAATPYTICLSTTPFRNLACALSKHARSNLSAR